MKACCIGASTYAEFNEFGHLLLYLDNGYGQQNRIHIEPRHWDELVAFHDRMVKQHPEWKEGDGR
jgi:hypothetical protein